MKRVFIYCIALICVLACTREKDTVLQEEPAPFDVKNTIPGQLIIKVSKDLAGPESPDIDFSSFGDCSVTRLFPDAGRFEARHRAFGLHQWYLVSFNPNRPVTKVSVGLDGITGVEYVEPVPYIKTTDYPFNDPKIGLLWGLSNDGSKTQWNAGCDVNAFKAWTIETGKPEVIVAVNDAGVDYSHEDLAANMWVNTAELNGTQGEDDDNNGYVDDIYGYSFMSYDGTSTVGKIEPGDHGTHVAGTIAAVNNNGIGVAGVAGGNGSTNSGVRIMVTQTLDGTHGAKTPESIVYAADNGAVLMNCSWGYTNPETPTSSALLQAIRYFNKYAGKDPETEEQTGPMDGGLIVFAAGNEGLEISHPAMEEEVFAVAALSANYVRSYFTSFGEWVDICAPGGDANRGTYIHSTLPGNTYGNMQGSSMAAPHVTGVAALLVSYYGVGKKGFTRDKLIYLLQSTANKRALEENGSFSTKLGAGLVDAYAALIADDDSVPMPVSEASVSAVSNTATFSWTVPGSEEVKHPYCFNLYYSTSSLAGLDPANPSDNVETVRIVSYGAPYGTVLSQELKGLEFNTKYYFRINSESVSGAVSALSQEYSVQTGSNTKPVITPLDGTSMTMHSHESKSLRFRISDPDGHTLSYSLDVERKGTTVTFDGVDTITFTVDAMSANAGTYGEKLIVSDSYETDELEFSYTILSNNAPTVVSELEDQLFTSLNQTRTLSVSGLFTDADNETLTYSISSSTVSIIVKTDLAADGSLTLTSNSYGSATFTITAADAHGATAETTFRVLVRDGNTSIEAYPNPVKDFLMIRPNEEGPVSVSIISSLGATVFSADVQASPFDPATVDLRNLPSGIYKAVFKAGSDSKDINLVKL